VTYYNEFDGYAGQWLRNLCAAGHLPVGVIDERDIREVQPSDLPDGHAHFFAGIGGWPLALRLAGWPDDLPVWTGSCPCQPFSIAGRGKGAADKRHLWPEWLRLIRECRPLVVVGEQVASPAGRAWLAAVRDDLEALGYAVGGADLCAAGVGAPHIRQRLYWVAVRHGAGLEVLREQQARKKQPTAERGFATGGVGHPDGIRFAQCEHTGDVESPAGEQSEHGRQVVSEGPVSPGSVGGLVQSDGAGPQPGRGGRETAGHGSAAEPASPTDGAGDPSGAGGGVDARAVSCAQDLGSGTRVQAWRVPDEFIPPGATGGTWADADWWLCRDGKIRPAQRRTFPLAAGVPGRVGKLRAYGNAIVPELAATFVRAVMDCLQIGRLP